MRGVFVHCALVSSNVSVGFKEVSLYGWTQKLVRFWITADCRTLAFRSLLISAAVHGFREWDSFCSVSLGYGGFTYRQL